MDLKCPSCQRVYHTTEENVGRAIKCSNPKCLSIFVIEEPFSEKSIQPAKSQQVGAAGKVRHNRRWSTKPQSSRRIAILLGAAVVLVIGIGLGVRYKRKRAVDLSDVDNFMREQHQGAEIGSNSQSPSTAEDDGETAQGEGGGPALRELEPKEPSAEYSTPVLRKKKHTKASEIRSQSTSSNELPARPVNPNRLPDCAKEWPDVGPTGHGVFSFNNGTTEDAIVHLFTSSSSDPVRSVYVPSQKSCEIDNLGPESYTLRYATGLDWNAPRHDFNWGASYYEPNKRFTYTEELNPDRNSVNFVEREITLHTVPHGNLDRHRISKEQFLRK